MPESQVAHEPVGEIVEVAEATRPDNRVRLEPRCRICRNDQARRRVNGLLARGATDAHILRTLETDNAGLAKRDRITIDSIRNHCGRHFPVQQVAGSIYREIVERRAREAQVDFVEGVATALTPLAFYEVTMAKAYRVLVDDGTEVTIEMGLRAAEKLQAALNGHQQTTDVNDVLVKLERIIEAVRSTVPKSMWGEIVRKLDRAEQHPASPDPAIDGLHEGDYSDVTEFATMDDEL